MSEELQDVNQQPLERRAGIRPLSQAEIDAIADAIVAKGEKALLSRFYGNLGRGLWEIVWKALLLGALALAAYGAGGGRKPWE